MNKEKVLNNKNQPNYCNPEIITIKTSENFLAIFPICVSMQIDVRVYF